VPAALDKDRLGAALLRDLGADLVSTDADDRSVYGRDWTRGFVADASAVARPRSTADVAKILAYCNARDIPVVPSGGRTGLAAGAFATSGELVLSLERLNALSAVDTVGATLRVGAGAVTEAVHQHAASAGLAWPIDLASKGSCQVGGNIATNAGGVRVIRYGHTRSWVLGLEVVTAEGQVLQLGGALEKNNTGPDLRQLFIGSEGILGVVTAATLKLTELPRRGEVLLLALESMPRVLDLFEVMRRGPLILSAFEYWAHNCLERVCRHRSLSPPFAGAHPYYALVEVEPREAHAGELDGFLESLLERGVVSDALMAQDGSQRKRLWTYREGISESLSATGFPHKNDVALPVAALGAFTAELERHFSATYPGWDVCLFGHIGDGNIHINTMKPDNLSEAEFLSETHRADAVWFALVQKHGGSISAEHGVGLLKKAFLHYSRSAAEVALFRGLKSTLDPRGILNPGKVFDP
jgi:FAD/FMN-containing dehydrogenase